MYFQVIKVNFYLFSFVILYLLFSDLQHCEADNKDCSKIFDIKPTNPFPLVTKKISSDDGSGAFTDIEDIDFKHIDRQMSKKIFLKTFEDTGINLAEKYKKSLEIIIQQFDSLSHSEARYLYILLTILKRALYQDFKVDELLSVFSTAFYNHTVSNIKDDPKIDEIFDINDTTDFKERLQKDLKDISITPIPNFGKFVYDIYQEIHASVVYIEKGLQDKKNIAEKIKSSLSQSKASELKIYSVFFYSAVLSDKAFTSSFSNKTYLLPIFSHFLFINRIIRSAILPYHINFCNKLSELTESASAQDFISILDVYAQGIKGLNIALNLNESSDLSNIKILIFSFTTDFFIPFINEYISTTLNIDVHNLSLKDTFKKIKEYKNKILTQYIKEKSKTKNNLDLNIKSKWYQDDLLSLIFSIHYWIFSNIDENSDPLDVQDKISSVSKDVYQIYLGLNDFNQNVLIWYLNFMIRLYKDMPENIILAINDLCLNLADTITPDTYDSTTSFDQIKQGIRLLQSQPSTLINFIDNSLYVPEFDSDVYSDILLIIFSSDMYNDVIDQIDINLSYHPDLIDKLISRMCNLNKSQLSNFISKLALWTHSIPELNSVIKAWLKVGRVDAINQFFSIFDIDMFIQNNTYVDTFSDELFSEDGLINQLNSIPKSSEQIKKLKIFYLKNKPQLSLSQILFLLNSADTTNIGIDIDIDSTLNQVIKLPISDILYLIKQGSYKKIDGLLEQILLRLKNISLDEIRLCSEDEIRSILIFLIRYSNTSELEEKVVFILQANLKLCQELISECSKEGFLTEDITLIKDFLTKHAFLQKVRKIKRPIVKKVSPSKIDQGILLASEVQELINNITEDENVGSTINIAQILNKLVAEYNNTQGFSGGKKEIKEYKKSLDLILKMIQNFNTDAYPILKQGFYSNLENDTLVFLINNINSYSIKDKVYSIINYWISNNRFIPDNLEFGVDTIYNLYETKSLSTQQLYNLITSILKKTDFNSLYVDKLINAISNIISEDIKLVKSSKDKDYHLRFFNFKTITKDIIPIISKHQHNAKVLRNLLEEKLEVKILNKELDENSLYILKLNRKLINSLYELPLFKKIILLSVLSDESYLYIKNNDTLQPVLQLTEKNISTSKPSEFILDLYQKVQSKLSQTQKLGDLIKSGITTITSWSKKEFESEEAFLFREQISIYQTLLYEINLGFIPIDFSSRNFKALGYDVYSTDTNFDHYIEVKSKMSLFSTEYPPNISINEARVALNLYKETKNSDYLIYLIPLNLSERKKYGKLIVMDINWTRLEGLYASLHDPMYDNPNYQIVDYSKKIFLKDFTENLYVR